MLGNTNLNDTECPEDKPSILKYCNVNVPCPQSCLPASLCDDYAVLYCKENDPRRQELLESLCKDNCCNCNCAK